MKLKFIPCVLFYLFTLIFGSTAIAANVVVIIQLEVTESENDQVAGTITAEIANTTGSIIRNVNLRLENAGSIALERDMLQFGQISDGEIRKKNKIFYAQTDYIESGEPILWRLDYDDANGIHQQEIIISEDN